MGKGVGGVKRRDVGGGEGLSSSLPPPPPPPQHPQRGWGGGFPIPGKKVTTELISFVGGPGGKGEVIEKYFLSQKKGLGFARVGEERGILCHSPPRGGGVEVARRWIRGGGGDVKKKLKKS